MILEARGLSKEFSQGQTTLRVLDQIDFSLSQGETVAIVGQSGSGKSTLLGLLAGLDTPTSGSVRLQGTDLASLSEAVSPLFEPEPSVLSFSTFI